MKGASLNIKSLKEKIAKVGAVSPQNSQHFTERDTHVSSTVTQNMNNYNYNTVGNQRSYPNYNSNSKVTAVATVSKIMLPFKEQDGWQAVQVEPVQTVERVVIPDIHDKTGRLSSIIEEYEDVFQLSVVPLEITTVSDKVKTLQRHDIVIVDGVKYASSRIRIVNQSKYDKLEDTIFEAISEGIQFSMNLLTEVNVEGSKIKTLALNRFELAFLFGRFRDFNPQLKQKVNATGEPIDYRIEIG